MFFKLFKSKSIFQTNHYIKTSLRRMSKSKLEDLTKSYTFIQELPIDRASLKYVNTNAKDFNINKLEYLNKVKKDKENDKFKTGCYSLVTTEEMPFPKLLHVSEKALKELELSEEAAKDGNFLKYVSGNELIPDTHPWSHCYVGHQFGSFAGRLGDGRAMSLVEIINSKKQRWELQLKGSGETPYSRMGDGFAVLRSSVREYLASEANHALGIPTTRALSLVVTSQLVHREKIEPGALVCRLAPSWIRFGSFQLFQMSGEIEALKILTDYTIRYHFPHLIEHLDIKNNFDPQVYKNFFIEVVKSTAYLVATWQVNGFCHGVLNTDNMSILGLTLDYGPYGFLGKYDPTWTPNLSDYTSRYNYENQPDICAWNLVRLGQALHPLFENNNQVFPLPIYDEGDHHPISPFIKQVIELYDQTFENHYYDMMSKKLGFKTFKDDDIQLIDILLKLLKQDVVDYHIFFRRLSKLGQLLPLNLEQQNDNNDLYQPILKLLFERDIVASSSNQIVPSDQTWIDWIKLYLERIQEEYTNEEFKQLSNNMLKVNPRFILRNWILQEVIDELYQSGFKKDKLDIVYDLSCKFTFDEDDQIDFIKYPHLNKQILEHYSSSGPSDANLMKCSCSS